MTTRNRTILAFLAAVAAAGIFLAKQPGSSDWFVEYPLPLEQTHRFFDIGIVDANGDELLDIYTSNHHFRQSLLLADGHDVVGFDSDLYRRCTFGEGIVEVPEILKDVRDAELSDLEGIDEVVNRL